MKRMALIHNDTPLQLGNWRIFVVGKQVLLFKLMLADTDSKITKVLDTRDTSRHEYVIFFF